MASCGELAAGLRAIAASLPTPALAEAASAIQAAAHLVGLAEGDTETARPPCASARDAIRKPLDQLVHDDLAADPGFLAEALAAAADPRVLQWERGADNC